MADITKKEFIERITSLKHTQGEAFNKIKEKTRPLILWGKGNYATSIIRFMEINRIELSAVCVDEEYISVNGEIWEGLPVFSTAEISKKFERFDVVIGFANFREAEKKKIEGCRNYYFLDNFHNIFDHAYILQHAGKLYDAYSMLGDERSKETMLAFIEAKITGYPSGLYDLVDADQYFPSGIIKLDKDESFVDAGAFNGDTIKRFSDKVKGNYNKIYAFEPGEESYAKLEQMAGNLALSDIYLYKKGVWKEKGTLKFELHSSNAARNAFSDNGTLSVEVDTIDNAVKGEKVTFIKMDVEGSEFEALQGAAGTIRKYKPRLAICVYHKQEDLVVIPEYIKSLNPDYKLYLRQHLYISQELVLYAV